MPRRARASTACGIMRGQPLVFRLRPPPAPAVWKSSSESCADRSAPQPEGIASRPSCHPKLVAVTYTPRCREAIAAPGQGAERLADDVGSDRLQGRSCGRSGRSPGDAPPRAM
ncbi:hypothetical protein C8Q77DRAFT_1121555 [Trametes polyzona]|nr:hypothetical protein C8Q77DRAFT_1121555 [Trametes polyzona]